MGILDRLKAVFTFDKWRGSSVEILGGSGVHGEKPWPFNYQAAVEQCRSWVYRCAMGNAQAAASVPLRLYVRKRTAREMKRLGLKHGCVWRTRPVSRAALKWLSSDRVSAVVRSKAMQFGDDFEEVVDEHPVLAVLRGANSSWNGYNLAAFRFLSQELTGNAYLHPVLDEATGNPVELWPMLPQWVWIVPGRSEGEPFVKGYRYGQNTIHAQDFTVDEVLHFRYPNVENLYYGMGKVEAAWSVLGLMRSERTMQKALFDNHARPDAIINIEGAVGDQVDRFDSKIQSLFRGARNAGKMLVVGHKATYQPLSFPPKDLGSTNGLIEEIAGVFGYPVTKLKANDPNRSNAETGDAGWMKDTIAPMLVQDEESLNQNGFMSLFNGGEDVDGMMLAYDDPVPSNKTFDLDRKTRLVAGGIITINEARMEEGMEPVEGGDVPRVNGTPLDKVGVPADPFGGLFGGGRPPADAEDDDEEMEMMDEEDRPMQQNNSQSVTVDTRGIAEAVATIYKEHHQRTRSEEPEAAEVVVVGTTAKTFSQLDYLHSFECGHNHAAKSLDNDDIREDEPEAPASRLMRGLRDLMADTERRVLAVIASGKAASKIGVKTLTQVELTEIEKIIEAMEPTVLQLSETAIREVIAIAARRAMVDLKVDPAMFNMTSEQVVNAIRTQSLKLAGSVPQTTLAKINGTLAEGMKLGESAAELSARVQQTGQFSPLRAEAIARSESARAYVTGRVESWEQSGVVQGKQWEVAAGACEFCEAIGAKFNNKTIGLRDAFFRQGETLQAASGATMVLDYADIVGPPSHVSCRCNIIPILVTETST